jgi:tetratricopeptide (TPR) repeat protein
MKRSAIRFVALFLALGAAACLVEAQNAPSYDALIQQGKIQLQSGTNDLALASAEQAIKSDATRWEGYALAGGALMNLKRYDEAITKLSHAIERAPQDKQSGLQELRRQCFAAESRAAPASPTATNPGTTEATTTQAEIVLWKSIENSTNREDFQNYLSEYANGAFMMMARARLEKLTRVDDDAQAALNGIRARLKPTSIGSKYPTTYTPTAVGVKACRLAVSTHVVTSSVVRAYKGQVAFSGDYVNTFTYDLSGPDAYVEVQDYLFWDNNMRKVHKNGESAVHFWSVALGSRNGKVAGSCHGWQQSDAYGKEFCDGTDTMYNSAQVYPFLESDQSDAQKLAEGLKALIAICSK